MRKSDMESRGLEALLHQRKPQYEYVWDKYSGFNSPMSSNDAVCDVSTSQRHEQRQAIQTTGEPRTRTFHSLRDLTELRARCMYQDWWQLKILVVVNTRGVSHTIASQHNRWPKPQIVCRITTRSRVIILIQAETRKYATFQRGTDMSK